MATPGGDALAGDLGKNYRGDEHDWEVPPLIWEAQAHCNYWRQTAGMALDAATLGRATFGADELPDEQTAIMAYHQWVLEYHNRLREYREQIHGGEAQEWWDNRTVDIQTYRGQSTVTVTVQGGALDVLQDILPEQDLEPGAPVQLGELVGLQSLIFVRRIRTTVDVPAGTARDPDRTERREAPDWLGLQTLYTCHDGLSAITADLGFVPDAKPVTLDDEDELEVNPGHWEDADDG